MCKSVRGRTEADRTFPFLGSFCTQARSSCTYLHLHDFSPCTPYFIHASISSVCTQHCTSLLPSFSRKIRSSHPRNHSAAPADVVQITAGFWAVSFWGLPLTVATGGVLTNRGCLLHFLRFFGTTAHSYYPYLHSLHANRCRCYPHSLQLQSFSQTSSIYLFKPRGIYAALFRRQPRKPTIWLHLRHNYLHLVSGSDMLRGTCFCERRKGIGTA